MRKTIAFICGMMGMGILTTMSINVYGLGYGVELTDFGRIFLIPMTVFGTCLLGMSWIYFFYIQPKEIDTHFLNVIALAVQKEQEKKQADRTWRRM